MWSISIIKISINTAPSTRQCFSVYYVCENCVLLMDTAMKDWVNDGCANCFNFLIKYSSSDYVIHIENVVVDFRSGIRCLYGLNSFTAVDMKRSFIEQFVQNKVNKMICFSAGIQINHVYELDI